MSMSSVTRPVLKPLPFANSCIASAPGIFSTKSPYPNLSIPSRPINLHISCSHPSLLPPSFSLKRSTLSSTFIALVAQTSDWAQQNGERTFLDEDPEEFEAEASELGQAITWGSEEEDVQNPRSDWGAGAEEGSNEASPEPPEEAKLFVGNLPYDVNAEHLAGLFEQAGVVEEADVIYNRETDQSRGFGFVTMTTVEEAEKAVEMFHHYDLNGRLLTVNKAAPKGSPPVRPRRYDNAFRIHVGNLPWDVDNARLEQVFSEHGKVLDAHVVVDRDTNRSRGFAFVTMSSETELDDAIAALDGQILDGRVIRVSKAEERPRRGFS